MSAGLSKGGQWETTSEMDQERMSISEGELECWGVNMLRNGKTLKTGDIRAMANALGEEKFQCGKGASEI